MATNEGVRKTGDAIVVATTPDVCMTPMGSAVVPVAYQILARFDQVMREVASVRMTGKETITTGSRITQVVGDEAGTAGGMMSGLNRGYSRAITHSKTVRARGEFILYHSAEMWMNCSGPEGPGNTKGKVIYLKVEAFVKISSNGEFIGETNPQEIKLESPEEIDVFAGDLPRFSESIEVTAQAPAQTWLQSAGEQVGGFFKGVYDAGAETVTGLVGMGKGAWNLTGGWLTNPEAAAQTWENTKNVVGAVVDNPGVVWDAIKEPYVTAWSQGRYGEAIGRGTFEVLSTVFGPKGADKLAKTTKVADTLGDVAKVGDKIADTAKAADKIADTSKALDTVGDTVKAADKASDTAKAGENLSEAQKAADRTGDATSKVDDTAKVDDAGKGGKGGDGGGGDKDGKGSGDGDGDGGKKNGDKDGKKDKKEGDEDGEGKDKEGSEKSEGEDGVKVTKRSVTSSEEQLQKKYKHAKDFGVEGNYSKENAAKFKSAIDQHVADPATQVIEGTYRGVPVTHFINPQTGLNVVADSSGQFLSGWKLSQQQLFHVLSSGKLGGG